MRHQWLSDEPELISDNYNDYYYNNDNKHVCDRQVIPWISLAFYIAM